MVKLTDTKTNTTYQLELSLEDFQKAQKGDYYYFVSRKGVKLYLYTYYIS